jgi:glycosyltransferase involved in cell wall biosynthesis
MALPLMDTGIVVIGRNEGERLRRCLESLPRGIPIVYADSGSSDDSLSLARSLGVDTLACTPPFSAARARNEGFSWLIERHPGLRYVQFLDGDCTLFSGWLEAGARALEAEPQRAVVTGELLERDADGSAYSRLCAMEWRSPPGEVRALGGIAMMRADVFHAVGGYRPEVIAGEDSELGVRMALAGYKVTKIAPLMATHEAGITRFSQWWRRAVRAGHAIGQRSHLNGGSALRDCVHERNSVLFWGIGLPLLSVSAAPGSLLLLWAYAALWLRVWQRRRSALYATFVVIGKFANALGLARFYLNKLAGRYAIIEYK